MQLAHLQISKSSISTLKIWKSQLLQNIRQMLSKGFERSLNYIHTLFQKDRHCPLKNKNLYKTLITAMCGESTCKTVEMNNDSTISIVAIASKGNWRPYV